MASVAEEIRGGIATAFDALRDDVFFDPSDTVTLLKPSDTENEYEDVLEITSKWFFEDVAGEYGRVKTLFIADDSNDLTEALTGENAATAVRYGGAIYQISDGPRTPPEGTNVMWQITLDAETKRSGFSPII